MYGTLQGNQCSPIAVTAESKPTILSQLTRRQEELTNELARVSNAIEKLNNNPDFAEVLEAMSGVRFY